MPSVFLLVSLVVFSITFLGAGMIAPGIAHAASTSGPSSAGNVNQLQIVTTVDKPDANNYGWVVINTTSRQWIDAPCRIRLDQAGVTTSITAWSEISAISDSAPVSCTELLLLAGGATSDGVVVTAIVTTPDRASQSDYGWVVFEDNTKQWIDSDCRSQLVSSGLSLVGRPWNAISVIQDATTYRSCGELQAADTTIDNDPPITPPSTSTDVSYGDSAAPARSGPGWSAVDNYFAQHPRLTGECSQQIHDRYWAKGADGRIHPTWHPIRHSSGCSMAHDHGDDPRTSEIVDFSQGVPFAMAQGARGNQGAGGVNRHEDHVGHKVVVQNNWFVVNGDPQQGDKPDTGFITRTDIQCDWLSKLHQGSHSKDALGNNGHEYFLNVRCTDGLQLRLKTIVSFGPEGTVTNVCSASDAFGSGVAGTIQFLFITSSMANANSTVSTISSAKTCQNSRHDGSRNCGNPMASFSYPEAGILTTARTTLSLTRPDTWIVPG